MPSSIAAACIEIRHLLLSIAAETEVDWETSADAPASSCSLFAAEAPGHTRAFCQRLFAS